MRLLVGYATAQGSTREIAERMASRLMETGLRVDVLPVDSSTDVTAYGACVIGSAIHSQKWLPDALKFVERNASALARIPTWLFSVGMPGALGRPFRKLAMSEESKVVGSFRDLINPRDHRLFSGVISPDAIPAAARLIFKAMGGRFGDFRDWQEIEAWANSIVLQLRTIASP